MPQARERFSPPNDSPPAQQRDAVDRILDAAAQLFAEKGFDAVSMNAVAAAADVSKANVFHHFTSKQTLYLAVLKTACSQSTAALDEMGATSGPFAERLRFFIRQHLANLRRNEGMSRLILREVLDSDRDKSKTLADRVINQNFSKLVEFLREGQFSGALRADVDPAMVATLIVGANVFFFQSSGVLRHLAEVDFADQPERYTDVVADILLRGIVNSPTSLQTDTRK